MRYFIFTCPTLIVSFLLGFQALGSKSRQDQCPALREKIGAYNVIQNFPSPKTGCFIGLMADTSIIKGPSRSFQFFETGQMINLVKINDQSGRNYRTTGSRIFFILPTQSIPKVETFGLGATVTDASGLKWTINESGNLKSESGCDIEDLPLVSWENKGGFRVKRCPQRIVLDLGFKRGSPPIEDTSRIVHIIDPNGLSCALHNTQVFDYSLGKNETHLRYPKGPQLFAALKRIPACAKLNLNSLLQEDTTNFDNSSRELIRAEPNKHSGAR
ncbi:MAG: hypothetical protein LW875_12100 [Proteobacteria bacterium]|nr:hypothetical protein [Pseudomonadota bacterium]